MLEINSERVQAIAQMATEHSWAAELMKLEPREADAAEEKVCRWISSKMGAMYPESDQAERVVRMMWLHVMEMKAISAYLQEHPGLYGVIPEVFDVEEAVWVAESELNYSLSEEDKEAAKEFLTLMQLGVLKPEL
jgi:hypothetical protein